MGRFVKAIQRLDLLDAFRVYPLAAAVGNAAGVASRGIGPSLGFGQILLNRPTRHKLNHHKSQQQHAQQRGKHQKDAFEDVKRHGLLPCPPGVDDPAIAACIGRHGFGPGQALLVKSQPVRASRPLGD